MSALALRAGETSSSAIITAREPSGSIDANQFHGVNPRPEKTLFLNGSGQFVGRPPSSSQQLEGNAEGPVTVNLVNVSIPQAAKAILGDILGVKYTVAPRIDGKITIQTPKPISKSAVIDLFQTALRANGAAVVKFGDSFKIVPASQAAIGANIRLDGAPSRTDRLGTHVQIVQLHYVSANEIKRLLEPISPPGGILRADAARNTITLSGTSQEIASMMEAISLFDIDVMKGMSFALVPVTTAQPEDVADELRKIFASDHEGPMADMVRFIPNKQLSAILVISPQRKYLKRVGKWVHRLDARAQGSEKQFYTYTVQNRRAQELADVLQSMYADESNSARSEVPQRNVAPQYREASVQSDFQTSSLSRTMPTPGGGASHKASFQRDAASNRRGQNQRAAKANAGSRSVTGVSGSNHNRRFRIAVDEGKNSLLIEATPAEYHRLMKVIRNFDVMPKQVLIQVTIAEVSLNDELKFGVRWFFKHGHHSFTLTDAATGAVSSVFPGFSYAMIAANVAATLNTLNSITDVNVVSSPSLTVLDNHTAYLQIGDQVPITTQSAQSVLSTGAPIVNSISYKDTGIILMITPRINASGRVLLDLDQEVSSVVPTTTSGIDSPTIRQRKIKTSVVVNNGEGLALGGLIETGNTTIRKQAPIVGDIPIVGALFRNKDNTIHKTELIIIIKPLVMRTLNEARWITDEFRRELQRNFPLPIHHPRTVEHAMRRIFD